MIGARLTELSFRAGSAPGAAALVIRPNTSVVIVGPNNSGKSTALRELEDFFWEPGKARTVIDAVEVAVPETETDFLASIDPFRRRPPQGQVARADTIWVGHYSFRAQARHFEIDMNTIRAALVSGDRGTIIESVLKLGTVRLDGRTRFGLTEPRDTGDLRGQAQNHLWQLFVDDMARETVRSATFEAFGWHVVIDATSMRQFTVKMSKADPGRDLERNLNESAAISFMDTARPITEFGDGVQTFTGLLAAVHSLPHSSAANR